LGCDIEAAVLLREELSISALPFVLWAMVRRREEAMKYMLLINQGDAPTPRSPDEWATLSEDEQRAVYADYQAINQTPGVTPGLGLDAPETEGTLRSTTLTGELRSPLRATRSGVAARHGLDDLTDLTRRERRRTGELEIPSQRETAATASARAASSRLTSDIPPARPEARASPRSEPAPPTSNAARSASVSRWTAA
jgi:hypothetical protein